MFPDESDVTDQTNPFGEKLPNRASQPLEHGAFACASVSEAEMFVEKIEKMTATRIKAR
jgi:hypothetical protein